MNIEEASDERKLLRSIVWSTTGDLRRRHAERYAEFLERQGDPSAAGWRTTTHPASDALQKLIAITGNRSDDPSRTIWIVGDSGRSTPVEKDWRSDLKWAAAAIESAGFSWLVEPSVTYDGYYKEFTPRQLFAIVTEPSQRPLGYVLLAPNAPVEPAPL